MHKIYWDFAKKEMVSQKTKKNMAVFADFETELGMAQEKCLMIKKGFLNLRLACHGLCWRRLAQQHEKIGFVI